MKIYQIVLFTTLTITVQAYESDILIWITDADYPETVEAGGVIDLEVTVSYNFSQAARLNVWVMDGPWYSYCARAGSRRIQVHRRGRMV